ncbi:hypothetical protein HZA33_03390 [Candidatus Pacearchaeota archaeon]|nr:hypothetical protein [Candidatus Pacearchaeota archaeon]
MKKNKRAISTLVATVLLILITVAAVGIIWGAIMPVITRTMEIGQACLNARVTINTESGYTCYKTVGADKFVNIMISRGSEDFTLSGINLILIGGGTSTSWNIQSGKAETTATVYSTTPVFPHTFADSEFPAPNEEKTYTFKVTTQPDEAKVAPIVKVGATLRTCSVSSSVPVPKTCAI